MSSREKANKAEQIMRTKLPPKKPVTDRDMLSTGITLLNLATYGRPDGGYAKGHIYWIIGRSQAGKAQPLSSKILTPSGWILMGDMEVGDEIIDPDGGVSEVAGIFPQGEKAVYEITLSDGSETHCCLDHLWTVQTVLDLANGKNRTLSLRDMIVYQSKGRRLYVPFTKPCTFTGGPDLPIHPYLLGVLLGNGFLGKKGIHLSSTDEETLNRVRDLIPASISLTHRKNGDYELCCSRGTQNILLNHLRDLKLSGHLAHEKFIPEYYLLSSVDSRLALLHGLMDTDGTIDSKNSATYSTSSSKLRDDVVHLVRSLGGKASFRVKKSPAYVYKGERRFGRDNYNVVVRLPNGMSPFLLSRKAEKVRLAEKSSTHYIVSIRNVGRELCQCIMTTSKQQLYVTDDFMVTHNTWLAKTALAEAVCNPSFKDHELVYDDVEHGALMDTERYFGKKLADRIAAPATRGRESVYSVKVSDFVRRIWDRIDKKEPFIWVVDSLDGLVPDKPTKMGDGKAKAFSEELRKLQTPLHNSGSILIMTSQAKVDMRSMFGGEITSGGRSPEYYSTWAVWLRKVKTLKRSFKGTDYRTGTIISAKVSKNRLSGRDRMVYFPFDPEWGIDNIGANINFILQARHWKKEGGKDDEDENEKDEKKVKAIIAPEFNYKGPKQGLIKLIENDGLERELEILTGKVWQQIEDAIRDNRKPRYS